MQPSNKQLATAIANSNQTAQDEVYKIAKTSGMCPEVVKRHYQGSVLSLWEIKEFADWKKRLPTSEETDLIARHGVTAMKTLFK